MKISCSKCKNTTDDKLDYFEDPNDMWLCNECFLKESITIQFKSHVHNLAKQVDPQNDEDWQSLSIGFALGKGKSPEYAREFAMYLRYNTDLG